MRAGRMSLVVMQRNAGLGGRLRLAEGTLHAQGCRGQPAAPLPSTPGSRTPCAPLFALSYAYRVTAELLALIGKRAWDGLREMKACSISAFRRPLWPLGGLRRQRTRRPPRRFAQHP